MAEISWVTWGVCATTSRQESTVQVKMDEKMMDGEEKTVDVVEKRMGIAVVSAAALWST